MRQYLVTYLATVSRFHSNTTKGWTLNKSKKEAASVLKRKLSSFNPLIASTSTGTGIFKSRAGLFMNYLKERNPGLHNEAGYAYREYERRVKMFNKDFNKYLGTVNM